MAEEKKVRTQAVWTWQEESNIARITFPDDTFEEFNLNDLEATNVAFITYHGAKKLLSEKTSRNTDQKLTQSERIEEMRVKEKQLQTIGGLIRERKAMTEADRQARALKATVKMADGALVDGKVTAEELAQWKALTEKMNARMAEQKTYTPEEVEE